MGVLGQHLILPILAAQAAGAAVRPRQACLAQAVLAAVRRAVAGAVPPRRMATIRGLVVTAAMGTPGFSRIFKLCG